MKTFVLISVVTALLGMGVAVWKEKKLPDSISAIVYAFKGGWRWAWTAWLWVVVLTICIPLIEVLGDGVKALGFFTLVCLGAVGAMPLFEEDTRKWHYTLAIGAGILSQVCVALVCPLALLVWLLMLAYVGIVCYDYEHSNGSHWYNYKACLLSEILCYVGMVIGCIAKLG